MLRWKPLALWLCVGMIGGSAGFAAAQSMEGLGNQAGQAAAQSYVATQGGALTGTAMAADPSVVAGSAADPTPYESLGANPSSLPTLGATAGAADPTTAVVSGAY